MSRRESALWMWAGVALTITAMQAATEHSPTAVVLACLLTVATGVLVWRWHRTTDRPRLRIEIEGDYTDAEAQRIIYDLAWVVSLTDDEEDA